MGYREHLDEFDQLMRDHALSLVKPEYEKLTDLEKKRFDKWFPNLGSEPIEKIRQCYRIIKATIEDRTDVEQAQVNEDNTD